MRKFKFFFVTVAIIFVLGLVFGCRQQPVSAADKSWSRIYNYYKRMFDENRHMFTDNEEAWFRADLQYAHYYPHNEKIQDKKIEDDIFGKILHDIATSIYWPYDAVQDGVINWEDACLAFMLTWAGTNAENKYTCHMVRHIDPDILDRRYACIRVIYEYEKTIHISYIDVHRVLEIFRKHLSDSDRDNKMRASMYVSTSMYNPYNFHKDTIWIEGKEY